jgi:hypothetical protein
MTSMLEPGEMLHSLNICRSSTCNTPNDVKNFDNSYFDATENGSVIHFHFKELGIVKYSRDQLFGVMDIIGKYFFVREHGVTSVIFLQFFSTQ